MSCQHPAWFVKGPKRTPYCVRCHVELTDKEAANLPRRLRKIQVQIVARSVEQIEALRALAKSTRVPMAVYLREAVDLVLAKHLGDPGDLR